MKNSISTLAAAVRSERGRELLQLHLERLSTRQTGPEEITWAARRVPLSRGYHHGGYAVTFVGQPLLRFESNQERLVLKALAADPCCHLLATQPVTVHFVHGGRRRRYTPDILVVMDPVPVVYRSLGFDRITLVEVKPASHPELEGEIWNARRAAVGRCLRMPVARYSIH